MSRPARVLSKTGIYHIVFRGINRQYLFEEEKDFLKMLEIIEKVKKEFSFEVYAYCLMTNHVHLFIKEKSPGDIKKIMHKILSTYVGWFNFKYQRSGSLIANRYKSEPIENDNYYLALLRYIHHNPIKANMVSEVSNYKWSSYSYYANDKISFVIDKEFALSMFNKDRKKAIKAFIKFHEEFDNEDFEVSDKIRLTDAQLRRKMQHILKIENISTIGIMDKPKRNLMILKLRKSGFTIRQIERLTGISRGVIYRIQ